MPPRYEINSRKWKTQKDKRRGKRERWCIIWSSFSVSLSRLIVITVISVTNGGTQLFGCLQIHPAERSAPTTTTTTTSSGTWRLFVFYLLLNSWISPFVSTVLAFGKCINISAVFGWLPTRVMPTEQMALQLIWVWKFLWNERRPAPGYVLWKPFTLLKSVKKGFLWNHWKHTPSTMGVYDLWHTAVSIHCTVFHLVCLQRN